MKHLKKINEWKKNDQEDQRIDQENSDEIRDFFSDLGDLGCKLTINIDTQIVESYNIVYYLENTLGFSVNNKISSLEDEIQKNKEHLDRLNEYINLSHDFMMRLKSVGYKIPYFRTGYEQVRGLETEAIQSQIRLSK